MTTHRLTPAGSVLQGLPRLSGRNAGPLAHAVQFHPGSGEGEAGGGDPPEITFTPEQTAKVNEIVSARVAAAQRQAKAATTGELLQTLGVQSVDELAERLQAAKPKTTQAKPDQADPVVAQLQQQLDQMRGQLEAERAATKAQTKAAKLLEAATAARAQDAEVLRLLMDGAVDWDEQGQLYVKGENGPRLNDKGRLMTPAELAAEILAAKPYLAAPSGTAGGGGRPNPGPGAAADPKAAALEAKNPTAYLGAALRNIAPPRD